MSGLQRAWVPALALSAIACTGGEAAVSVMALDTSDCPLGSNVIEGTSGPDTLVGTAGG